MSIPNFLPQTELADLWQWLESQKYAFMYSAGQYRPITKSSVEFAWFSDFGNYAFSRNTLGALDSDGHFNEGGLQPQPCNGEIPKKISARATEALERGTGIKYPVDHYNSFLVAKYCSDATLSAHTDNDPWLGKPENLLVASYSIGGYRELVVKTVGKTMRIPMETNTMILMLENSNRPGVTYEVPKPAKRMRDGMVRYNITFRRILVELIPRQPKAITIIELKARLVRKFPQLTPVINAAQDIAELYQISKN